MKKLIICALVFLVNVLAASDQMQTLKHKLTLQKFAERLEAKHSDVLIKTALFQHLSKADPQFLTLMSEAEKVGQASDPDEGQAILGNYIQTTRNMNSMPVAVPLGLCCIMNQLAELTIRDQVKKDHYQKQANELFDDIVRSALATGKKEEDLYSLGVDEIL